MTTLISLICWIIIEYAIIYAHIFYMVQLLGQDAFMRNTPQELADKIMYIVYSCVLCSSFVGIIFFSIINMMR